MPTINLSGRRTGRSRAITILLAPDGRTDAAAIAWATSPLAVGDGSTPLERVQQGRASELPGAIQLPRPTLTLAGLKQACQAGLDVRGPDAEPVVDRSGGGRC